MMLWLADMYPASVRGDFVTPRLDEIRPLPPLQYFGFTVSHVNIRFRQGRMTNCSIDLSIPGLVLCPRLSCRLFSYQSVHPAQR